MVAQLPLSIRMDDDLTLDNFMARKPLGVLMEEVAALLRGEKNSLYFWGPPSTGKSHLLQALSQHFGSDALYLPLKDIVDIPPEAVLENHERVGFLAIDDVDSTIGTPWEEALFHCFNQRRDLGLLQIYAAAGAPATLVSMLPDLRSRLGSLTIYQFPRFDDAEIEALLAFRAARRGISLGPDVLSYLLARAPRSVPAIMALLEELDREGLARGRAITVPLIASLKLVSMDPSV